MRTISHCLTWSLGLALEKIKLVHILLFIAVYKLVHILLFVAVYKLVHILLFIAVHIPLSHQFSSYS